MAKKEKNAMADFVAKFEAAGANFLHGAKVSLEGEFNLNGIHEFEGGGSVAKYKSGNNQVSFSPSQMKNITGLQLVDGELPKTLNLSSKSDGFHCTAYAAWGDLGMSKFLSENPSKEATKAKFKAFEDAKLANPSVDGVTIQYKHTHSPVAV